MPKYIVPVIEEIRRSVIVQAVSFDDAFETAAKMPNVVGLENPPYERSRKRHPQVTSMKVRKLKKGTIRAKQKATDPSQA